MALKNPFKLEKLKIYGYSESERNNEIKTFETMFNPASISMKHENNFQKLQGINTSGRQARFSHSRSDELELELILDGSGVTNYYLVNRNRASGKSVSERIDEFLNLCFHLDGDIHEPRFLKISWGNGVLKDFSCRLKSVQINYTSFDRKGAPLHAKLNTIFLEDMAAAKRIKQDAFSSPDLSHSRTVRSGDTLPLLAKEIYGSSEHYLKLARFNQMDDFRNLTPGQEIVFPPLEK